MTQELVAHREWIEHVVSSRISERDAVEDLVNDVLAEALSHASQIKKKESLAPWLYRVAVVKALQFRRSQVRQRRKEKTYSQRQAEAANAQWYQSPIELTLGTERKQLVQLAMKRLSGKLQEILLLKYVQNWTYSEIAMHLGISKTKVTYRLRMARSKLRTELLTLGLDERDV